MIKELILTLLVMFGAGASIVMNDSIKAPINASSAEMDMLFDIPMDNNSMAHCCQREQINVDVFDNFTESESIETVPVATEPVIVTEPTVQDIMVELNTSINRTEYVDGWTCYDYSVEFDKNNPDWDIVYVSTKANFCPHSHIINYQMFDDNHTMIIYDGVWDYFYYIDGWEYDNNYYHFCLRAIPVRNYKRLSDNRELVGAIKI